jgi:putative redox protein
MMKFEARPHVPEDREEGIMSRETRVVRFHGGSGNLLVGRLEIPEGIPRGRALFAHCFACSKDLKAVVRVSRALAERGFAVLRFDFTGIGESEGDFAETNFSSNLDDLVAAADFLAEESGPVELLVGHSLGGAAVLAAAGRLPGVRAVATISAPSTTSHLSRTLLDKAPELENRDEVEVILMGKKVRVRRQLLEDLDERHLAAAIERLGRPLLVFHSPVDEVVPVEHARRIYRAARHPKSFVSLDDADHLLLRRDSDARFVGDVLAAWAGRYLGADPAENSERERLPELEKGEVLARGDSEGYLTRLYAGRHRFLADEPESVGGTDAGPNPYDLLLAALGACKSMTVRMYADRKGWPLEGVQVRLNHERLHAEDCEECDSKSGRVDRIDVELDVEGQLDEEQRRRLLEISARCPVHRTLEREVSIRGRLAGEASELSPGEDDSESGR